MAEGFIQKIIDAKQIRVRDLNGKAKIEVNLDAIEQLSNKNKMEQIKKRFKLFGFSSVSVDPDGYSPGKINVI